MKPIKEIILERIETYNLTAEEKQIILKSFS